ncbi:S8 family serine peptidase [Ningiella sp. W23]|uniref:S8 family serine peptidase n=1 Tax=Ningiella sp. W23 TaxID=3023715 RepID=UPI0039F61F7F
MKLRSTTCVAVTCALLSINSALATEKLMEQLFVEQQGKQTAFSANYKGAHKRDITMVTGEHRQRIFDELYGHSSSKAERVVILGTAINSEYYETKLKNAQSSSVIWQPSALANGSIEIVPNDPFFRSSQLANFEDTSAGKFASPEAITAFNIVSPIRPSRIGIVDGEFSMADDFVLRDGANFVREESEDGRAIGPIMNDQFSSGAKRICDGDSAYHGLGVASIAAASMNNGVGLAGYSDADIVYARSMECGTGWSSDIAKGIYWLSGASSAEVASTLINDEEQQTWRQTEKTDVINLSLGGANEACISAYQNAIDFARDKSVVVVAAAGNSDIDKAESPGICEGVITVVALDSNGNKAEYSNYGTGVDIAVIGDGVAAYGVFEQMTGDETLDISRDIVSKRRFMSGTSMAAPIVSAAIAQLKQIDPSITPDEALRLIQETADPFPKSSDCYETYYCGAGILNTERAVQVLSGMTLSTKAKATPASNVSGLCNEQVLTLNYTALQKICETYQLDISGLQYSVRHFDNPVFNIYAIEKGTQTLSNSQPIAQIDSTIAYIRDIDATAHDFLVRACDSKQCLDYQDTIIEFGERSNQLCTEFDR